MFENGGFDVVVGNPPYIKEDKRREIFEPLNSANKKYKATKKSPAQNKPPFASQYYQGKMDFWQFFACLGLDLLEWYFSFYGFGSWGFLIKIFHLWFFLFEWQRFFYLT